MTTINEIEGMKAVMPNVDESLFDQIIVSDYQSTDGTVEWAKQRGYFVVNQQQPGLRRAFIEALPYVEGDIVVMFSPDGNSVAERLPELIDKMKEGYDMVIVSRYLDGAKSDDDDFLTGIGNWCFTRMINTLFGGKYTDAMVMYRACKKNVFYDLELEKDKWYTTPERLFNCRICLMPLLSMRAAKRKLKIGEIPGDEPARTGGERKLHVFRWGASYIFQALRDFIFWRRCI
jgi:glycosyltransferase involved in cell wall biosynthesis